MILWLRLWIGIQEIWIQLLAHQLTSCVSLGESLNLFVLCFPICKIRIMLFLFSHPLSQILNSSGQGLSLKMCRYRTQHNGAQSQLMHPNATIIYIIVNNFRVSKSTLSNTILNQVLYFSKFNFMADSAPKSIQFILCSFIGKLTKINLLELSLLILAMKQNKNFISGLHLKIFI